MSDNSQGCFLCMWDLSRCDWNCQETSDRMRSESKLAEDEPQMALPLGDEARGLDL